jgi:glycosyltransferase involved in cell wall biosynthesis
VSNPASGVIWVGPVYHRGGYGSVSRNYLTGLARLQVPVRVVPYQERHYSDIGEDAVELMRRLELGDAGAHPALVIHSVPELFRSVRARGVTKTVGCTIFETHSLPPSWVRPCNSVDELWVPSQFNRLSFAKAGVRSEKIQVVPYGVEAKPASTSTAPRPTNRPFVFLYVFEFSWRKGFDLLLNAFLHEFRLGEAKLILKVLPRWRQSAEAARREVLGSITPPAKAADSSPPEVVVISGPTSAAELEKLFLECDLYISTDRANGWGMPCMEAMALGKPAASIDWSGSTEFMRSNNSVLIQPTGRLTPVDSRLARELPELYGNQCWAEVSESEVRRSMRWALEHPRELADITAHGQQTVRDQYSPEAVASLIVERLGLSNSRGGWHPRSSNRDGVQLALPHPRVLGAKRRMRRLWARWVQLPASRLRRQSCADAGPL